MSSPLSTPYLTDGEAALQSSQDIVRYADDLKQQPETALFETNTELPAQAAIFEWYRNHLRCEPVDIPEVNGALQPAGMQFNRVFDFHAFCSDKQGNTTPTQWSDTTLQQLPPVVHAAVLAAKSAMEPAASPSGGRAAQEGPPPPSTQAAATGAAAKLAFAQQPDAAARLTHVHDRVGPLTRRVAYHFITADEALFQQLGERSLPGVQSWLAYGILWPLFINGIRSLNLTRPAAEKGMAHLRGEFDSVSLALETAAASGHQFLSGPNFGAVDLYWASLVAPVLLVQACEGMHAHYPWRDVDPEMRALATELRGTLAGRHALACFALYRAKHADMPHEEVLECMLQSSGVREAKL